VRIAGANVPTANYPKVPMLMKKIVKSIGKKEKNSIRHVADIHAVFEQIHPFSDGNGRVGRLLMHAMLLCVNLPPAVISAGNRRVYMTYLNRAQTKDDITPLEDFICDAVAEGYNILERKA